MARSAARVVATPKAKVLKCATLHGLRRGESFAPIAEDIGRPLLAFLVNLGEDVFRGDDLEVELRIGARA